LPSSGDPGDGAAIFWKIEGEDIQFAVAVKASGWISFGISEAGGMLGADVVSFTTSNPSELVDSYILESRADPLPDDCNNWTLISSATESGWIILEMKRALDTGDAQDHKISNDKELWIPPSRLIAAWGDSQYVGYHGLNRARNAVRLFDDSESTMSSAQKLENSLVAETDGYFDLKEDNFEIPATGTTYHYVCKHANDIKSELDIDQEMLTMIGAVPVLSTDTAQFVHHFTVYIQKDCSSTFDEKSMIYGWAPGDQGWKMPDDVGFPLFNNANRQAVMIEIHYNNPGRLSGQMDSSGIRFHYSLSQKKHDAAILELADPYVFLIGQDIDSGLTKYEFTCPGACSSAFMWNGQGVTVLAEYLHMHQTGTRMTNEVIRNSQVVHESMVDVFEFDQQGSFKVQQDSYQIMPGDSFKTSCYYRNGYKFGLSSEEEMCIAYVLYYPAREIGGFNWACPYAGGTNMIPSCEQEVTYAGTLKSENDLGRTFGISGSECNRTPMPTPASSLAPSQSPSTSPTSSSVLSHAPSPVPRDLPSLFPSTSISPASSSDPSDAPSLVPSDLQSLVPSTSISPTSSSIPSDAPPMVPSELPSTSISPTSSSVPSDALSLVPSNFPTKLPSQQPLTEEVETGDHRESSSNSSAISAAIYFLLLVGALYEYQLFD
jgi:hypothetical protein